MALIREHLKAGKTKEEIAEMFLDAEIDGGKPHDIDVVYGIIAKAEKSGKPETRGRKPATKPETIETPAPAKDVAPEAPEEQPAAKVETATIKDKEPEPKEAIAESAVPIYEKWKVNVSSDTVNGETKRRIERVGKAPIKEVRISDQLADMLNRSLGAGDGFKFMYVKK